MKTILMFAALVAAPSFAPALAQSPAGDRIHVVSYADLDLSREAGVRVLDRRLRAAIRDVCGTASDADVEGKNEVRQCRAELSQQVAVERGRALASVSRTREIQIASGQ